MVVFVGGNSALSLGVLGGEYMGDSRCSLGAGACQYCAGKRRRRRRKKP
jgi:hypothetical protein